jgi:Ribbon-helix-helix protein, copG family
MAVRALPPRLYRESFFVMPIKNTVPRGRPPLPYSEVVYFRCPPHLMETLDALARASGLTRSRYIAEALLELTGTRQKLITKTGETRS